MMQQIPSLCLATDLPGTLREHGASQSRNATQFFFGTVKNNSVAPATEEAIGGLPLHSH